MPTTALDLARAYATGNTCPIRVLDTLYERIDDAPNAFISLTKELAYVQAQSAKIRWQQGNPLSIFDGIPIAYKDLFDIKHTITTAGAKLRADAPPATQDAHVVSTLHHMGLTCVGKTNLSEFAYSGLGLNPHFGTPTNVTNPDHVAGGSSSGSATVVGHGIVPLAIGATEILLAFDFKAFCRESIEW
ncbi:MAG: amidase family protein [Moraxella equi]|nr:amidase family protein [Moraxella equi]